MRAAGTTPQRSEQAAGRSLTPFCSKVPRSSKNFPAPFAVSFLRSCYQGGVHSPPPSICSRSLWPCGLGMCRKTVQSFACTPCSISRGFQCLKKGRYFWNASASAVLRSPKASYNLQNFFCIALRVSPGRTAREQRRTGGEQVQVGVVWLQVVRLNRRGTIEKNTRGTVEELSRKPRGSREERRCRPWQRQDPLKSN